MPAGGPYGTYTGTIERLLARIATLTLPEATAIVAAKARYMQAPDRAHATGAIGTAITEARRRQASYAAAAAIRNAVQRRAADWATTMPGPAVATLWQAAIEFGEVIIVADRYPVRLEAVGRTLIEPWTRVAGDPRKEV